MNSLHVINGRKEWNTWVFDDPGRDLKSEPFVCGTSEIIDFVLNEEVNKCKITHAMRPFPGYKFKLARDDKEFDGYWYELYDADDEWCNQQQFWLCPATELFYGHHPETIYVKVESAETN